MCWLTRKREVRQEGAREDNAKGLPPMNCFHQPRGNPLLYVLTKRVILLRRQITWWANFDIEPEGASPWSTVGILAVCTNLSFFCAYWVRYGTICQLEINLPAPYVIKPLFLRLGSSGFSSLFPRSQLVPTWRFPEGSPLSVLKAGIIFVSFLW